MKVLLVGDGAREHAIAWKLRQSPLLSELLVAPGNVGTGELAENVAVAAEDVDGLLRLARERRIELTVVGPETPLAAGIADRFQEAGLSIFGPTAAAARIETSKSFAKSLMVQAGVPTGRAEVFDDFERARRYVAEAPLPVVVKADGLAAGKGVEVAVTRESAEEALRRRMVEMRFGVAGQRVLVEEFLEGPEVSVFAFVDGERMSPLAAACDYKPVGDGDTGPNTGGMGAYSPPQGSLWSDEVERRVRRGIIEPVVDALRDRGCPYRGVLYCGLMFTADGPKVIEFNCRLGDPEAQVVLPRLKTDLLEVMTRTANGDLAGMALEWEPQACVGVVVASGGYPEEYETGFPISGIADLDDDVNVFHAGTRSEDQASKLVSAGGRVLTVVGSGGTLRGARSKTYRNVSRISFTGIFYRNDIALLR